MTAPKLTGNRCQCAACGEYFNRERVFDRHRIGEPGNRRCLTAAEMTARGWNRNAAGFWIMDAMDSAGQRRIRPESVLPLPAPLPKTKARDSRMPAQSP
jgi:hypothetical protein